MAKRGGARSKSAPKPDFHRQTVLFQWALDQLGVTSLADLREKYQIGPDSREGISAETGRHYFFDALSNPLAPVAGARIRADRLAEYEQNILADTLAINTARARHGEPTIQWKYHQYLALLFTEMYLDRYFADAAGLRAEINEQILRHNEGVHEVDRVSPFPIEPTGHGKEFDDADPRRQLGRLAFWCATGAGKTLLMHMHILQFRRYQARAGASRGEKLEQVLLVTPNEGLTRQHATELARAGFKPLTEADALSATLFAQSGGQVAVKIIDIHKFRDDHGDKTVATEAFEGRNLVLVDEGHRGAGRGEEGKWMQRRDQLARDGFTIEYSATFKEAVTGDEKMRLRYARSILFDYAYRSFYRDGYGKDFTILNLEDNKHQTRYLTAALLLYYQQLRVWKDGGEAIKPFRIDKPLWVFVGHTVVGKSTSKDDEVSVSDVVQVLLFVKGFLADAAASRALIRDLLENGFTDSHGRNLLANRLQHLDTTGDKGALAKDVHEGILRDVFNAPGGGSLAVQLLKSVEGELALKVGEAPPFGVVNVGDPGAVAEACQEKKITKLEDDQSRASLFERINHDDSPINLLVGSRKFTEGWNSWRVSTIGLMNLGKNEGAQIIQLFGRGVRLRGYRMGLRRSSVLAEKPTPPRNLRQVETLQVFGVKADYMKRFRDWIYEEVPEAQERAVWDLPVVKTLPKRKLKTIQIKNVIEGVKVERGQAFRTLGPLVRLRPPDPKDSKDDWLRNNPTRLNWLPRVVGLVGKDKEVSKDVGQVDDRPRQRLDRLPTLMFDVDGLLFGIEEFKAGRGLDRLHVDRDAIRALLADATWYELFAADDDMRLDRIENRAQWQRMAQQLLNAYAEKFYRYIRGRWEAPYIEVVDMQEDDPNLLESYAIETTEFARTAKDIERIEGVVRDLREAVAKDALIDWRKSEGRWRTVPFAGHLYQPLLYVGRNSEIRLLPVALDKHEAKFVEDLAKWCKGQKGAEVYLLRNQAVTGLGFFQAANFYPDFLLWVQDGERQHLALVDPKGLHNHGPSDPKVLFATQDIPRLQKIVEAQSPELALHAFIVSNTPLDKLKWTSGTTRMTKDEIEALGVLFQEDDATEYIEKMMGVILREEATAH